MYNDQFEHPVFGRGAVLLELDAEQVDNGILAEIPKVLNKEFDLDSTAEYIVHSPGKEKLWTADGQPVEDKNTNL